MSCRAWLFACSLLSAGCGELAKNYPDPQGPRYAGSYGATAQTGVSPTELRVVTFNIQFGTEYERAAEELASEPELAGVDVLLLQEMDATSTDAIARQLAMRYVYYPGSVQHGRDFGNAVLSRWPIVSDQKLILPHESPTDGRIRIAVQATLDTPFGAISAYSVHTETPWLGPAARLEQASAVLEHARAAELCSLAGGDFNTGDPGSLDRTVAMFRSGGFAWASRDAGETHAGFALDHIFAHRLTPLRSGSVVTRASDHRPSWAQLSLESRN